MKLAILFGASAVGKTTVGQALAKITDLKLFHSHMGIEPVIEIFGRRDIPTEEKIREAVFEEFVKSDLYGIIFTYFFNLDKPAAWDYFMRLVDIFECKGAEIYFVELVASQEVRLQRNGTENRLLHKPSKRNVAASNARLIELDEKIRIVSRDNEIPFENYMKIDNTRLQPEDVADLIKNTFLLM
ncbi:MAG: AAA family ATPase [Defluviitaleaceae bacterium]|nr:AAA family ATPase [Defluviitaleaceae bacterium]